jgi:hypothetical protein
MAIAVDEVVVVGITEATAAIIAAPPGLYLKATWLI